jgi:glycosyltransferase involved in cell wall biosynthesis
MLKIAIDARFYGSGHTGLGRYTTNVLTYLPKYLRAHTLQILLRDSEYDNFPGGKNIQKVRCDIPHYSLKEQVALPNLLSTLSSNLLYTLHFNTPVLSKIPTIVTVHDLIKSHFVGSDTTTRSPLLYAIKRNGYNQVIKRSLSKAKDIIVPTNTVKNNILALFPQVKPELIHPIKEAPDEIFRSKLSPNNSLLASKINLPSEFILFVGNVYPHKNLRVLLDAMKLLPDLELVIVAKSSPFLSRILAPYDQTRIHILSGLTDSDLASVYKRAAVLVTPSLMEGYGLTGLEALMLGTPVIASNIPVYREVYGNKVTYFDPKSAPDLIDKLKTVLKSKKPAKLDFPRTWDDVARDISEVINARCTSL